MKGVSGEFYTGQSRSGRDETEDQKLTDPIEQQSPEHQSPQIIHKQMELAPQEPEISPKMDQGLSRSRKSQG